VLPSIAHSGVEPADQVSGAEAVAPALRSATSLPESFKATTSAT